MKLTGVTRWYFFKYKDSIYGTDVIDCDLMHAVIVDFFDSIGIYINVYFNTFSNSFIYEIVQKNKILNNDYCFKSRKEATNAAIEKANEIYNEQND